MRPPRLSFIGAVYHITARCNNREFLFQDDDDFRLYLYILGKAKEQYSVKIHAYCITSNHVHLLVCTPEEDNISKFMQRVNGGFAQAYNRCHGRSGRFWGGRFYSTIIESETQFFNTTFYIEANMLRCGAVQSIEGWKWSSYHANALGKDDPLIDFHYLYLALADTPEQRCQIYQQMTAERIREKGLQRDPTFSTGVVIGSQEFVEDLVESAGQSRDYYLGRKVYAWEYCFSLKRNQLEPPDTG